MVITENWLKEHFDRHGEEKYMHRLRLNYIHTSAVIEAQYTGKIWFVFLNINGFIASNSITTVEGIEDLRKAILNNPDLPPLPVIHNINVTAKKW